MARSILGANKKLVYSLIPKSRYDEVTEFMGKNFFTSETISKTLNVFPGGVLPPAARKVFKHRLGYGTCIYATTEDTKRIVGVVTSSTVTDEQNAFFAEFLREEHSKNPQAWDNYITYKKATMNGCSSLQELAGCTKIYDMHELLVVPEYRKFGVARELMHRSVALGEQLDYEIIIGCPTTIASYKIMSKMGFEFITKVMLNSIIVDGKPFLDDPEAFAAIMGYRPKKSESQ